MSPDVAIRIVKQQFPCGHLNIDTTLGNGKIWARCDDCGATFEQEDLPRIRERAEQFEEAIHVLTELVQASERKRTKPRTS